MPLPPTIAVLLLYSLDIPTHKRERRKLGLSNDYQPGTKRLAKIAKPSLDLSERHSPPPGCLHHSPYGKHVDTSLGPAGLSQTHSAALQWGRAVMTGPPQPTTQQTPISDNPTNTPSGAAMPSWGSILSHGPFPFLSKAVLKQHQPSSAVAIETQNELRRASKPCPTRKDSTDLTMTPPTRLPSCIDRMTTFAGAEQRGGSELGFLLCTTYVLKEYHAMLDKANCNISFVL
ncbi:hypothetical protein VTK26DRAFT_4153 [Humicola hyalothermophila]